MTLLSGDIDRQARIAAELPSVEEWVQQGGQIEQVTEPPRREAVMAVYGPMIR